MRQILFVIRSEAERYPIFGQYSYIGRPRAQCSRDSCLSLFEENSRIVFLFLIYSQAIPSILHPNSTMPQLMIYGATGYTGKLAAIHAGKIGLDFVVAGRTEKRTAELASSLGVPFRIFRVDDLAAVASALADTQILLNCAGPFARTTKSLVKACVEAKVHYLDISAELDSYHLVEQHADEAARQNVMLMPGCGGSVAMLGCLVKHLLKDGSTPSQIDVALHVSGSMSRGSAVSAAENVAAACLQRLNGWLVPQDATRTEDFDFDDGKGKVACFPVTLPDLVTMWKSTGAANIKTYVHTSGAAFPSGDLSRIPEWPTEEERNANLYHAAATVIMSDGSIRQALLHTINGYTFTPIASIEAVRRMLGGEVRLGFQTPADIFGADFVGDVQGSEIKVV